MSSIEVLLCTTNEGKIDEFRRTLHSHQIGIPVKTPKDIGIEIDVEEDGTTLDENAIKKVAAYLESENLKQTGNDQYIFFYLYLKVKLGL